MIEQSHWTDEVSQAWIDDAGVRTEQLRNAGVSPVDALDILRKSMPSAVMSYLDRQAEERIHRISEEFARRNGRPFFVLETMIEPGGLEVVDTDVAD